MALNLTPREQQLVIFAFQSMDIEPKINYKRFADLSGLKVNSATTIWGTLKKKLLDGSSGGSPLANKKAPAKGRGSTAPPAAKRQCGRKRLAEDDLEDSDDEDDKLQREMLEYSALYGAGIKSDPAMKTEEQDMSSE